MRLYENEEFLLRSDLPRNTQLDRYLVRLARIILQVFPLITYLLGTPIFDAFLFERDCWIYQVYKTITIDSNCGSWEMESSRIYPQLAQLA